MSVLHVSIQHSNIVLTKSDPAALQEKCESAHDEAEGAANIYAISSVDGNVIYHVSNGQEDRPSSDEKKWRRGGRKKKPLINPVKVKRIFAVTTLTSDNKGAQYVTERNQTMMRELEVPASISGNRRISVFVNPLSLNTNENSNDSYVEDDTHSAAKKSSSNPSGSAHAAAADVLKNARRFKKPEFNKGSTGSLDESLFESVDSNTATAKSSKDKSENVKKLNGEVGSSSLDSITNSLTSSSPEIVVGSKSSQKTKKEMIMMPNSAREIAGTIIKGKYHSMNNEFSNTNYEVNDAVGSFEATTEIPSWTMGDEEADLETSTTAEEYFSNSSGGISVVEEVLNDVVEKVVELCEPPEPTKIVSVPVFSKTTFIQSLLHIVFLTRTPHPQHDESIHLDASSVKRNSSTSGSGGVGVHNLHSHMLLYCGVYDSTRTLYALRILRNELLTNARMFLCAAATTGVANNPRSTPLLTLLARHRKSIFGRNFHGDVANTEFVVAYRSSMYLELLLSVCLYFARSYYPNLGQMRLTQEEISGNRQVR